MTATGSLRLRVPLATSIVIALLLSLPSLRTLQAAPAATHGSVEVFVDPALSAFHSGTVSVIVQKYATAGQAPERALARLGGSVTRDLPIVDGFAATVPAASLRELARVSGIRVISLNRKVAVAEDPTGGSPNSVYPKVVRSKEVNNLGVTGQNITVLVIDTATTEVADLSGRIVPI